MSSAASKRAVTDTSIDLDTSGEEEINKKIKMSSNEVISILVLEGGIEYINEPAKLKKEWDHFRCEEIKETKITINNHLIITFHDQNGCNEFLSNSKG